AQPTPTAAPAPGPTRIVPKGLRAFDAADADFFLELLPGPRDRDGLPEAVRFWKARVEEADPDNTFAVGLIYGPSGCGKSSLVKAGLLPRLLGHVLPVYVEADAEGTEARLLAGLRKRCPEVPAGGLRETLAALRRRRPLPGRPRREGAGGVRPGVRRAARGRRRADPGAAAVPRAGGARPGPGGQGHLRPPGGVRRDDEGPAVDAGHAQGGRRHR